MRLCAEKLRSGIPEDKRLGVQEKCFDFDIEVVKVQQLYARDLVPVIRQRLEK